jgi:hypothetical protein
MMTARRYREALRAYGPAGQDAGGRASLLRMELSQAAYEGSIPFARSINSFVPCL